MSREQASQALPSEPQDSDRPAHPVHGLLQFKAVHGRRMTVEEALNLPALISVRELAPLWDVTVSQMHRLDRTGALDAFKVKPAVGPRCFSGLLIGRYVSGEPLVIPSFGRKRAVAVR